jgi:hypothetical protein|tara:strand:- start:1129 stop:1317 length:189 start_codon:yes stop_codon:yes gene_type:complete
MRYISDVISAVEARKVTIEKALAQGTASNYDSYQRLVGEYAGLQTTIDIINNLLKEEEEKEL